MWIVDILIEILTHLFRAGVESAQKRADAAPPSKPFPQDPPYVPPQPQAKPVQQPGMTSLDPAYERSPWRTLLSLLVLILMGALALAWIIYMQK